MDSVTHALVGGAIGFAVGGREAPRKALLWGAAIALLPDLDLLIPRDNDLEIVTRHRDWTHAWLAQSAAAPLFAGLLHRFDHGLEFRRWLLLTWLVLVTHSALDALTVYGTQLFWPWSSPPVMIGSIFIIDPLLTLPVLIGLLAVVFFPRSPRAAKLNRAMLGAGVLYLAWGLAAQQWILQRAERSLQASGTAVGGLLATPTPFNSLLWRVLAVNGNDYLQGFGSVLDGNGRIRFRHYPRRLDLLAGLDRDPALERIDWFTHGFYSAVPDGDLIVVRDLRMGSEPYYPFQYTVATRRGDRPAPQRPDRVRPGPIPEDYFRWLGRRIHDAGAGPFPPAAPPRDESSADDAR